MDEWENSESVHGWTYWWDKSPAKLAIQNKHVLSRMYVATSYCMYIWLAYIHPPYHMQPYPYYDAGWFLKTWKAEGTILYKCQKATENKQVEPELLLDTGWTHQHFLYIMYCNTNSKILVAVLFLATSKVQGIDPVFAVDEHVICRKLLESASTVTKYSVLEKHATKTFTFLHTSMSTVVEKFIVCTQNHTCLPLSRSLLFVRKSMKLLGVVALIVCVCPS